MNAIAALKSTRRICFERITNPQRKAEKDTNYERIECIKNAAGAEARAEAIDIIFADEPRVETAVYSGLTVDFAREAGADFLVRGVRSAADFEYERNLADINREIAGIETVLLCALPEYGFVSSSMVRELQANGFDAGKFLPKTE